MALQETLKGFIATKDVSNEKREERKHQEKEEAINNIPELQKKEARD